MAPSTGIDFVAQFPLEKTNGNGVLWVAGIVKDFIVNQDAKKIIILNASKRKVVLALSADPDIRIQEERGNFETRWLLKSKVERMSVTPTIAPVKRRSPIKGEETRISGLRDTHL